MQQADATGVDGGVSNVDAGDMFISTHSVSSPFLQETLFNTPLGVNVSHGPSLGI